MIQTNDKSKCCGCSACMQVCPHHAIQMQEDDKGFLYPVINQSICANCGLCEKACAFQSQHDDNSTLMNAYALQLNNEDSLRKSSSGGAFTAITDVVLSDGGTVVGSVIDDYSLNVHHTFAKNAQERDKMRGTKYVQSTMDGVFSNIKQLIEKGEQVLFTGTPCQNAALIVFLRYKPDNLFLVDLLCHGTPSNKLLKDHVALWQKRTKKRIKSYNYRSKAYAYAYAYAYASELVLEDDSIKTPVSLKRLTRLFVLNMRDSCYACPYASKHRYGDLTIGDMFDCGKKAGIYDGKGVSTVLVNTEKGRLMVERLKETCMIKEIPLTSITASCLKTPVMKSSKVEAFWNDYADKGYQYVLDKYAPPKLKSSMYIILWRVLYHLRLHKLAIKMGMQ